jgi:hypothetical protein
MKAHGFEDGANIFFVSERLGFRARRKWVVCESVCGDTAQESDKESKSDEA